jgi:hypothetical protein
MAEWLAEHFVPGYSAAALKPTVDPRTFRACGHAAARALGGKFRDEPLPGVCTSHERAVVVLPNTTVRVLLHHEMPLLGFAAHHPEPDGSHACLYDYIDVPDLAVAFGEAFIPVPKSALTARVDLLAMEREVGPSRDLQYWAPRCVGEILYNFWD